MRHFFSVAVALAMCAISLDRPAAAQSNTETASKDLTGFTSYVEFDGTTNSAGQEYVINSNVGYTFSKHFGMDIGVPFYFATAPPQPRRPAVAPMVWATRRSVFGGSFPMRA